MNDYKSFPELKEELGNNYDFKLYEMGISALKEIENLQQENQKYKEVIDKAIDLIEKSVTTDIGIDSNNNIIHYHQLTEDETSELLDILKEVE